MLLDIAPALSPLLASIPDFTPTQPPGTEGLTTALGWIQWIVVFLGIVGFLVGAGTLAFAAYTGRELNSFKGIFLACGAAILAGAAGGIIQVFA